MLRLWDINYFISLTSVWLRCFIHRLISPMHQTCITLMHVWCIGESTGEQNNAAYVISGVGWCSPVCTPRFPPRVIAALVARNTKEMNRIFRHKRKWENSFQNFYVHTCIYNSVSESIWLSCCKWLHKRHTWQTNRRTDKLMNNATA